MEAVTEEEVYVPFEPTDKPVTSLECLSSGDDFTILKSFSSRQRWSIGCLTSVVKKGLFQGLWLCFYITGNLGAMVLYL